MKNNKIFIISGPSGVGKGTLVEHLLKRVPRISRMVSVTTRKPRVGETSGLSYYFVSEREFLERVKTGRFLEWANVHGNLYGTPKSAVDKLVSKGQDVVLVIDVQGAVKVKKERPGSVLIFIEPPSLEELRKRLIERGTESPDILEKRVKRAKEELECLQSYNYRVINEDLNAAVDDLISIIENERREGCKNHQN